MSTNKSKANNLIPQLFFGLVESQFINISKQNEKHKEKSMGVLVDNNIILVSNLAILCEIENYELSSCSFKPLHFSDKYLSYLPESFQVEKIISKEDNWGLLVLDFPLGDFINFILKENNLNILVLPYPRLKGLSDNEIEKGNLIFYEMETVNIEIKTGEYANDETIESKNLKTSITTKKTIQERTKEVIRESSYIVKLSDQLFLLESQIEEENNILPGVIILFLNNTYYIAGFTTNNMVKISEETDEIYKYGFRITKDVKKVISENIDKLLNTQSNSSVSKFNYLFFSYLKKELRNIDDFRNALKDNCYKLHSLIHIFNSQNAKDEPVDQYNMNAYIFMLFNYFSSINSRFDLTNLNISMNGAECLSSILKANIIEELDLRGNSLFTEGLKKLISPTYLSSKNNKMLKDSQILSLKKINLDKNKLTSKGMKYLRHIIKDCYLLESLSLRNNSLTYLSLKYLLHCFENKNKLTTISLSNNILMESSGKYLYEIILTLPNLTELNLENNCLGTKGINKVINALIEGNSKYFKRLNISKNSANSDICNNLSIFLKNKELIEVLLLNGNPIGDEGIKLMFAKFHDMLTIKELGLSNCQLNNGLKYIFSDKKHKIEVINLSLNKIENDSSISLCDYLPDSILKSINLAHNLLGDEGVALLVEVFNLNLDNKIILEELKLNSNKITNQGGEQLLNVLSQSETLVKLHIENNEITWREDLLEIRVGKGRALLY